MPRQNKSRRFEKIIRLLDEAVKNINNQCFKRAKIVLLSLLSLQPNYANAYYLLSICHKELEQMDQHKKIKKQAENLNPVFYQNLKKNDRRILQKIQSTLQISKILSINFDHFEGESWGELINIFFDAKDLQTCYLLIRLYQQLQIQNQDKSSYQFSTMGIAYYQLALYDESFKKYQQAIQIKSSMYFYYNNCAIIKYIAQDYQKSLQFINKSLELKPHYSRTLFIQSFCLIKLGKLHGAMQKLKQAINQCPSSVHYRLKNVTNLLLYYPNQIEQSKRELTTIIEIIDKGEDSDSYFMCESNITMIKQTSDFLLNYHQNRLINKKKWNIFLNYFDQYLIKGHLDKYRLSKKMAALKSQIFNDAISNIQNIEVNLV